MTQNIWNLSPCSNILNWLEIFLVGKLLIERWLYCRCILIILIIIKGPFPPSSVSDLAHQAEPESLCRCLEVTELQAILCEDQDDPGAESKMSTGIGASQRVCLLCFLKVSCSLEHFRSASSPCKSRLLTSSLLLLQLSQSCCRLL